LPADVHANDDAVKSRVLAYWAARQKADLGAAYEFYSPTFRAQHSRTQFLSGFRRLVRFPPEEVRVLEVTRSPDGAAANVRVTLRLKSELAGQQVDIEATSEETWILEEGLWWKKDEPFVPNV